MRSFAALGRQGRWPTGTAASPLLHWRVRESPAPHHHITTSPRSPSIATTPNGKGGGRRVASSELRRERPRLRLPHPLPAVAGFPPLPRKRQLGRRGTAGKTKGNGG